MTVARILANKGHEVVTTQPHRTLLEVSKILCEKGIGAVVVTDAAGALLGIVSERDIVRALGASGVPALEDPVSRHMTARVVTTTRDSSVHSTMEMMTHGRFRHVPVVHNGRLEGLVSIGDMVKYRIAEIENERKALQEYIATA